MADSKLGGAIKEKLNIPCIFDASTEQLMRGLRNQMESLIDEASGSEMKSMAARRVDVHAPLAPVGRQPRHEAAGGSELPC